MNMTEILHLDISGRQTGKTTRAVDEAIEERFKTGRPIVFGYIYGRKENYKKYFPGVILDSVYYWDISRRGGEPRGLENPIVILDEFDHLFKDSSLVNKWAYIFDTLVILRPSKIYACTSPSYLRTDKDIEDFEKGERRDPILELLDICLKENYTRKLCLEAIDREYYDIEAGLKEAGLFYKGENPITKQYQGQGQFSHKC